MIAEPTTPGPQQHDTKPRSVLLWPSDLLTLYDKVASLQASSVMLGEQVATLQEQLAESQTTQQALLQSLVDSSTRLESLTQASEARAKLDKQAVDKARGERLLWAGGGVVVGAGVVAVLTLIFRH